MDCAEIRISFKSRTDVVKIVFVGDVHIGNTNADEKLIRDVVERIKEQDTYWIDLGDSIDAINMKDKRFDPQQLPPWIEISDLSDLARAQTRRYGELFSPIAHKCLVRLCGNHEAKLSKTTERDVYADLNNIIGLLSEKDKATKLEKGRRDIGYSGFLRLRFARNANTTAALSKTLFLHHGAGGGQLAGAKALRLERLPMAFDADVYAVGHTHTKLTLTKRRIGLKKRRLEIEEKTQYMLNVGSFMRGELSGYAEAKGLYPQNLGPVEIWIYPDKDYTRVIV